MFDIFFQSKDIERFEMFKQFKCLNEIEQKSLRKYRIGISSKITQRSFPFVMYTKTIFKAL